MARVGTLEMIGDHLIDMSKLLQALVSNDAANEDSINYPEDDTVKFAQVIEGNSKKTKKYRIQLKDKTNMLSSIPE
jgi:hypothetical protein